VVGVDESTEYPPPPDLVDGDRVGCGLVDAVGRALVDAAVAAVVVVVLELLDEQLAESAFVPGLVTQGNDFGFESPERFAPDDHQLDDGDEQPVGDKPPRVELNSVVGREAMSGRGYGHSPGKARR
jgi:hypothetical protein